jgi:hypothetical protein
MLLASGAQNSSPRAVLEDQQPQHHLGRCAASPRQRLLGCRFAKASYTAATMPRPPAVGVYPALAKIADFFGDRPVAETELDPPHRNRVDYIGDAD